MRFHSRSTEFARLLKRWGVSFEWKNAPPGRRIQAYFLAAAVSGFILILRYQQSLP